MLYNVDLTDEEVISLKNILEKTLNDTIVNEDCQVDGNPHWVKDKKIKILKSLINKFKSPQDEDLIDQIVEAHR